MPNPDQNGVAMTRIDPLRLAEDIAVDAATVNSRAVQAAATLRELTTAVQRQAKILTEADQALGEHQGYLPDVIRRLVQRDHLADQQGAELAMIDAMLRDRPALEDRKTRDGKIGKMLSICKDAEQMGGLVDRIVEKLDEIAKLPMSDRAQDAVGALRAFLRHVSAPKIEVVESPRPE